MLDDTSAEELLRKHALTAIPRLPVSVANQGHSFVQHFRDWGELI